MNEAFRARDVTVSAGGEPPWLRLHVARGFLRRGVGLMGCAQVPSAYGDGLLFLKCRNLHTFFMRFPLDVVFLDEEGRRVEARRGVRPWRVVCGPRGARHVFEVPAGCFPESWSESLVWKEGA